MKIIFSKIILIFPFKIDSITLDPDPNWAKSSIRIQIQCIWIHNTSSNHAIKQVEKILCFFGKKQKQFFTIKKINVRI